MRTLRERLATAVEQFDETRLPPRFADAHTKVRETLQRLEAEGIGDQTLVAVLMNEALPRLLTRHGLIGTGAILRRLADGLDPHPPPGSMQQ